MSRFSTQFLSLVVVFFGAVVLWVFSPRRGFKYHFLLYERDFRFYKTFVIGCLVLFILFKLTFYLWDKYDSSSNLDPYYWELKK